MDQTKPLTQEEKLKNLHSRLGKADREIYRMGNALKKLQSGSKAAKDHKAAIENQTAIKKELEAEIATLQPETVPQ